MNLRRTAWMILLAALIVLLAAGCSSGSGSSGKPYSGSGTSSYPAAGTGGTGQTSGASGGSSDDAPGDAAESDGTAAVPKEDLTPEKLAATIPYVGMPAEYIDMTICGPHTREDTGLMLGADSRYGYIWEVGEDGALRVETSGPEGTVTYVVRFNEELYWDEDGLPHMTDRSDPSTWCANPAGLLARWERFEAKRDKEVDDYATADDYADDYWYYFAEEIYYEELEHDGWDWETCCELGYMEACDHWYDNQPKPRPDV